MRDKVKQRPSLSSLPFQVSLFYGALFSIIFAILVGAAAVNKVCTSIKFDSGTRTWCFVNFFCLAAQYQYYNKRVALSVIIIWCVIEPIRLIYGFMGNLRENVSAQFCITSSLIALNSHLLYTSTIQFTGGRLGNFLADHYLSTNTVCVVLCLHSASYISSWPDCRHFDAAVSGKSYLAQLYHG